MKRASNDQPRLPLELPGGQRRRRRARRGQRATRDQTSQGELLSRPVVQTCGLCGNRQTVFEQAGVCGRCGGVMVKADPEEEW